MNGGWIKLHRQLLDWEWYKEHKTLALFLNLLLKANHKDGSWKGIKIKRGQVLTGRRSLSGETGLSEQEVRTALKNLKSTNEISMKSTSKNSLITLVNYDAYQEGEKNQPADQPADQPTVNQQSTSNQPTVNHKQELNNLNNVNKKVTSRFTPPTIQEVIDYCKERNNGVDANKFINHYETCGWVRGKGNTKIKSWKACVRTWEANSPAPEPKTNPRPFRPIPKPGDDA